MGIDIKKSITAPFQNRYWGIYMGIYALICYLPVLFVLLSIHFHSVFILIVLKPFFRLFNFVAFIPLGFVIQLAHGEIISNNVNLLTFKQSFSNSFKTGANLFILAFLYSFIVLFILVSFISYFIINDYFSITDLLAPTFLLQNEVIAPILTALLIFWAFTLVLIPYFFVAFSEKFEILDAFNWLKIFERLFISWKEFLISVACLLLINFCTYIAFIFISFISLSGARVFLTSIYTNILGNAIIPSQIVLTFWIALSGIIIISTASISFIMLMILYNLMAQVYKNAIQKEVVEIQTQAD